MVETVEVSVGLVLFVSHMSMVLWNYRKPKMNESDWEQAYWGERRGRTRVEQEMRRLTEVQLNTSDGFFVQPIGRIESCYRQCVGTPRQGMLVPSSRAYLQLSSNVSPEALDGLEEFSHLWLSFKFHLNTNTLKEAKAFNGVVQDGQASKRKFTFTGKVTPPMLKEKKGVLATRSPHRPNPIGVTLAHIERVDKKTRRVYLSACDLVQDTPILDAKPYVPAYDTVSSFKVPQWIAETIDTRNKVLVAPNVEESVLAIASKLKHYKNDAKLFMAGLLETLEADVRSEFQTKRRMKDASQGVSVEVPFDQTLVRYFWQEERTMLITEIVLASSVAGGGNYRAYEETAEMEDETEETRGSESKVIN